MGNWSRLKRTQSIQRYNYIAKNNARAFEYGIMLHLYETNVYLYMSIWFRLKIKTM